MKILFLFIILSIQLAFADYTINIKDIGSSSIIPDQNSVYDIGSSSFRWKNLHLGGGSIYIGAETISENPSADNGLDIVRLHMKPSGGVAGSACLHPGTVPYVSPDGYSLWINGSVLNLLLPNASPSTVVNHRVILEDENEITKLKEIRAKDANGLKLYDDSGNGIFVKDGGDVGIGVVDPDTKLEVNGSISMSNVGFFETIVASGEDCKVSGCETDEVANGFNVSSGACINAWDSSTKSLLICTDTSAVAKTCLCSGMK